MMALPPPPPWQQQNKKNHHAPATLNRKQIDAHGIACINEHSLNNTDTPSTIQPPGSPKGALLRKNSTDPPSLVYGSGSLAATSP